MSNAAPVQLRQVRDIGQVISDSFLYVRQNWKLLYGALIIGCLPPFLLGSFLIGRFFSSTMTQFSAQVPSVPSFGTMGLGYLFMAITGLMFVSIIQEHLRAYLHGETVLLSPGSLVARAISSVPQYFLIVFLSMIAIWLGLILLMIPGIWLMGALSLANPAQGIERAGAIESMGRSFKLVKDNWWNTFGVLFLLGLIVGVIAYAVMIPFTLLLGFGSMSGLEASNDPDATLRTMSIIMPLMFGIMGLVYLLLYPLPMIGVGLQYFNLVEQKERRGLGDRLSEFDQL